MPYPLSRLRKSCSGQGYGIYYFAIYNEVTQYLQEHKEEEW